MTRTAPYHTNSPEYPPEQREVYHDHSDCPAGRQIKPEHRESGKAGRRRCKDCVKLD